MINAALSYFRDTLIAQYMLQWEMKGKSIHHKIVGMCRDDRGMEFRDVKVLKKCNSMTSLFDGEVLWKTSTKKFEDV